MAYEHSTSEKVIEYMLEHKNDMPLNESFIYRILQEYYERQKSRQQCIFGIYSLSGTTTHHFYQLVLVSESQLEEQLKELENPSYDLYALSARSIKVRNNKV
jgi:hypothetical protein